MIQRNHPNINAPVKVCLQKLIQVNLKYLLCMLYIPQNINW